LELDQRAASRSGRADDATNPRGFEIVYNLSTLQHWFLISVMPNTGLAIELQPAERLQLEPLESAHGTPQQVALRCRIILRAVAGQQNVAIAEGLGVSRPTVQLWRKRVHEQGIGEVWEIAPGRGRKAHYDQSQRDRIVKATLQSKPKGMTHWSCRLMAEAQGVSKNTVNRLWQLHNIKPHLSRTFKLSRDAKFLEKLTDVVGFYMNPPDKAVVLCVDEKSQIQALERTQPGLPLKKGRCGTMTHDYQRNGTTTLFAALQVLNGKVIGECHGRHRHQEWRKFLRRLDAEFPPELKLHLGQLRHAQGAARASVAEEASPLCMPLCADQFQLAEFGGALVSRID
jgi:transposase